MKLDQTFVNEINKEQLRKDRYKNIRERNIESWGRHFVCGLMLAFIISEECIMSDYSRRISIYLHIHNGNTLFHVQTTKWSKVK